MYLESVHRHRSSLPPLPPATMIIDTRGKGEDVIGILAAEIENLTEEMRQQKVPLWNSLADFISFKLLGPQKELQDTLLFPFGLTQDKQASSPTDPQIVDTAKDQQPSTSLENEDQTDQADESHPSEQSQEPETSAYVPPFTENFESLLDEIDQLRNARISALARQPDDGSTLGRNVKEAIVRVIFLADASRADSLSRTASCAKFIKNHYNAIQSFRNPLDPRSVVNISVLCLNYKNSPDGLPTDLIRGLSPEGNWKHLDTLILSAVYRQDMAKITDEMQAMLAELLLYVLLIVSPENIKIHSQISLVQREQTPESFEERTHEQKHAIDLPPYTYLVGLSSLENSTRWGYRLLNFGLAEKALDIWLEKISPEEEQQLTSKVDAWLDELQKETSDSLLTLFPDVIPSLNAFSLSKNAASATQGISVRLQPGPTPGRQSVDALRAYLNSVTATYISSSAPRRGTSASGGAHFTSARASMPTLKDAALSVPEILSTLERLDKEDVETPLKQPQLMAYRVLEHNDLFSDPHGALPRARLQLEKLAQAITERLGKRPDLLNIETKKANLQKTGQEQIDDLEKLAREWPQLAASSRLQRGLANATFFLFFLLCFLAVVSGSAWLGQFCGDHFPALNQAINQPLAGIKQLTLFNSVSVVTFGLLASLALLFVRYYLLAKKRSAFAVEVTAIGLLLGIALLSFFTLLTDRSITVSTARTFLALYPPALAIGTGVVAFILALVSFLKEASSFSRWRNRLVERRDGAVQIIQEAHLQHIEDITAGIVEQQMIDLLNRAGLTGDKAGKSLYYQRIEKMQSLTHKTSRKIKNDIRLIETRLRDTGKENLYIREEFLDIAALSMSYEGLREAMDRRVDELKDLSIVLLRAMSEEKLTDTRQLDQETDRRDSIELQQHVQALLTTLTAVALCFSSAMPLPHRLNALNKQYGSLDKQTHGQLHDFNLLLDLLKEKIKMGHLNEKDRFSNPIVHDHLDISLAIRALAYWGQSLWENKNDQLNKILAPEGILARLVREKGDPKKIIDGNLGIRNSLSGSPYFAGLRGELYLLVAPPDTVETYKFLAGSRLESYADFPDAERLLLLSIQPYATMPVKSR